MGTKDKLIERICKLPKDFTWEELLRLLGVFGYEVFNKGKTSGSRVVFKKGNEKIVLHRPHPTNIIKEYKMKEVVDFLKKRGLIKMEN